MRRRGHKRQTFRHFRLKRIFLALGAIPLALLGVVDSFANIAAKSSPATAARLAPWNGKIAGKAAEQALNLSPGSASNSPAGNLARKAVRAEPTSVEALNVLGLQAQLRGQTEETRALFSLSLALSRRELTPRLWAIEEAVIRGDIDEALKNYDIALRTSNQASAQLFPVLASALAEPSIRNRVLTILSDKPVWREGFISYAARVSTNPAATALFFREGERVGLPVDADMRTALVDSFANQGLYAEAWDYYSSIRRGAKRTESRDPQFTFSASRQSLFDWTVTEFASIQDSDGGGVVNFSLPSTVGGEVLMQSQFLPTGRYRISGISAGIEQRRESLPYWTLRCGGQEIGRVPLPNSSENNGKFSGQFAVPPDCPLQTLVLVARPTDEYRGVAGQIKQVKLEPVL